jgi:hypothetical protein
LREPNREFWRFCKIFKNFLKVWLLEKKKHIFLLTLKNNLATKENPAPQSIFYITMCFPLWVLVWVTLGTTRYHGSVRASIRALFGCF